jgi:hypothetical protein
MSNVTQLYAAPVVPIVTPNHLAELKDANYGARAIVAVLLADEEAAFFHESFEPGEEGNDNPPPLLNGHTKPGLMQALKVCLMAVCTHAEKLEASHV